MLRGIAILAGAMLMLTGCSAATVSGTVVTIQPWENGGRSNEPRPYIPVSDEDFLEICKGNRVPEGDSDVYYCGPKGIVTGLDGNDVRVTDAQGAIVGLAELTIDSGELLNDGTGRCTWSFTLNDFDSESDFFTVEIEGVGMDELSRAELLEGLAFTVP